MNNFKFISNLLKSKQVKSINIDNNCFIITLKNDIIINIIIECNGGIYDNITYSTIDCYVEILKNNEFIDEWEIYSERESKEINNLLFNYCLA